MQKPSLEGNTPGSANLGREQLEEKVGAFTLGASEF